MWRVKAVLTEEEALNTYKANPFALKGVAEESAFQHGFRSRSKDIDELRQAIELCIKELEPRIDSKQSSAAYSNACTVLQ